MLGRQCHHRLLERLHGQEHDQGCPVACHMLHNDRGANLGCPQVGD